MTVIELKEPKEWADATLLKKSIAWMKERNNPLHYQAIQDEEEMLRSFFRRIRNQGKAASLSSAA